MNSRFIRAIFVRLIPLGHSTSQAPVFVQLPNPSNHLVYHTLYSFLRLRLTLRKKRELANLADTNSIADEFLHVATHAPHPIQ